WATSPSPSLSSSAATTWTPRTTQRSESARPRHRSAASTGPTSPTCPPWRNLASSLNFSSAGSTATSNASCLSVTAVRADQVVELVDCRRSGAGQRGRRGFAGRLDRDRPGSLSDDAAHGIDQARVGSPRAGEDHAGRVHQGDDRRYDPGNGLRDRAEPARPVERRCECADVEGGRARLPYPEPVEDGGEGDGGVARADGEQVLHFAGQPAVTAPHLAVGDHGTAQPFAEVQVGEVLQGLAAAFSDGLLVPGGPVDVVVDAYGGGDERGERRGRVECADEERRVGEMDESAGGAVDRIGCADDRDRHVIDG